MAAANTDLLRKKKSNFSTTLGSSVTDSDTTIPLASASGLPTDTAVTITIDRVDANGTATDAKMERVVGVVSGNNLVNCVRGVEGTAQAHESGAVAEDIWEADTLNDMMDAILVNHDQAGGHKADAIDAITEIKSTLKSGADTTLITGTKGTTNYTAKWNADGDLVDGYELLDEDDMSSDSATKLASQQSIKAYVDNSFGDLVKVVGIQVVDALVSTTTGDAKAFFRIPLELNGMNLVRVAASVYTAGTTGTLDIQIRNKTDTADMLSTKITIDSTETDTASAATAAVIDTDHDDVATGDIIAIDVDAIHTTAAKGLWVEMGFSLP